VTTIIHLRNGRKDGWPTTRGEGVTWCGKKLIGDPIRKEGEVVTYSVYGSEVSATLDLDQGDCAICRQRFDTAYDAAFPEGLKPIATIRLDDPDAVEKLQDLMHSIKHSASTADGELA
jgi:hypothetical protein